MIKNFERKNVKMITYAEFEKLMANEEEKK